MNVVAMLFSYYVQRDLGWNMMWYKLTVGPQLGVSVLRATSTPKCSEPTSFVGRLFLPSVQFPFEVFVHKLLLG